MIKELQANTIDPPDVELLEEAGDAEGEEEEEEQDDEFNQSQFILICKKTQWC